MKSAICINLDGTYECQCPEGMEGDPYKGECLRKSIRVCERDTDCNTDEKCDIPSGDCKCKFFFFLFLNLNCVHSLWAKIIFKRRGQFV